MKQPFDVIVDKEDEEIIESKSWSFVNDRFYCRLRDQNGSWATMTMIRYLAYLHGLLTDWDMEAIYIDKNTLNNSKSNIKITTTSERSKLAIRSKRKSGRRWSRKRDLPYGVYKTRYPGVFQAMVKDDMKLVYLGSFRDVQLAENAVKLYVDSVYT